LLKTGRHRQLPCDRAETTQKEGKTETRRNLFADLSPEQESVSPQSFLIKLLSRLYQLPALSTRTTLSFSYSHARPFSSLGQVRVFPSLSLSQPLATAKSVTSKQKKNITKFQDIEALNDDYNPTFRLDLPSLPSFDPLTQDG
jgi:hypothetical protein